jgi:hypothetical protein
MGSAQVLEKARQHIGLGPCRVLLWWNLVQSREAAVAERSARTAMLVSPERLLAAEVTMAASGAAPSEVGTPPRIPRHVAYMPADALPESSCYASLRCRTLVLGHASNGLVDANVGWRRWEGLGRAHDLQQRPAAQERTSQVKVNWDPVIF